MAEHQPFPTLAIKSNYSIAANYKINWIKYIIYSSLLIVLVCACVFVRVLTKIFAFTIQSIQTNRMKKKRIITMVVYMMLRWARTIQSKLICLHNYWWFLTEVWLIWIDEVVWQKISPKKNGEMFFISAIRRMSRLL